MQNIWNYWNVENVISFEVKRYYLVSRQFDISDNQCNRKNLLSRMGELQRLYKMFSKNSK